MVNGENTILIFGSSAVDELPVNEPWLNQELGEGIPEFIVEWFNGKELGDNKWKDFILTKFGGNQKFFASEVDTNYVFLDDSEDEDADYSEFIEAFSEFVEVNEIIEGEVYTCPDSDFVLYGSPRRDCFT